MNTNIRLNINTPLNLMVNNRQINSNNDNINDIQQQPRQPLDQQIQSADMNLRARHMASQLMMEEKKDIAIPACLIRIITKPEQNSFNALILSKSKLTIGRDSQCDYQITSIEISRQHAQFVYKNSNWYLVNLNSTNGIYVNGQKIQWSVRLSNDSIVTFGPLANSTFRYVFVENYFDFKSTYDKISPTIPQTFFTMNDGMNNNNKERIPTDLGQESTQNCNHKESIDYEDVNKRIEQLREKMLYCQSKMDDLNEQYNKKIKTQQQDFRSMLVRFNSMKKELLKQADGAKISDKLKSVIRNEILCSICYEILHEPTVLQCGHTFCFSCINAWKQRNDKCPICREKFIKMNKSIQFDSLIELILKHYLTDEEFRERINTIKSRSMDPAFNTELCPFTEQISEIINELGSSFNELSSILDLSRISGDAIVEIGEISDEIDNVDDEQDDSSSSDNESTQEDDDDNFNVSMMAMDEDFDDIFDDDENDSMDAVDGSMLSSASSNLSDEERMRRFFNFIDAANDQLNRSEAIIELDADSDNSVVIIDDDDDDRNYVVRHSSNRSTNQRRRLNNNTAADNRSYHNNTNRTRSHRVRRNQNWNIRPLNVTQVGQSRFHHSHDRSYQEVIPDSVASSAQ